MTKPSRFARDDDDAPEFNTGAPLRWPEQCNNTGCTRDTVVAMVRARRDGSTRVLVVPGSDAIERTQMGALRVRPGWQVLGWIARCAECYSHELYATGHGQMVGVLGRVPYATPAAVTELQRRREETQR